MQAIFQNADWGSEMNKSEVMKPWKELENIFYGALHLTRYKTYSCYGRMKMRLSLRHRQQIL